ncbi:winged helix-turn-helix domain-containing protein [Polymorphospora sp. NPDC050346]|uniref:winged helix-turn-helix domain-containing protein n=1 Tax=Polymorphospora sp. NPDC050346 TaxID=3155780 RepID=UPI0033F35267
MAGIGTTITNARRGGATADRRRHGHRRRRTLVLAGLTAAGLLTTLLTVQPVWAVTFTVTSTADGVDANIGDGVCRTSANTCTLRAAIQEANATLPGDTIQVPAGTYQLTRPPAGDNGDATGDLDIVSPLTIVGAGDEHTVVDGGQPPAGAPPERRGLDRLLEIHDTAGNVTVSGLTLREGYDPEQGGALLSRSPGLLRLQDVAVLDSYAGVTGGGIDLDGEGRVEISGSVVRGNATGGDGGGVHNQHEVELTLTDTTLAGNTAGGDGGGVSSTSKTRLTVTRGTVSGNVAGGEGGGVLADSERATTVRGTVFTGNTAGDPESGDGGGAGLYLGGSGGATVTGASFAENEAVAEGGGVAIHLGLPDRSGLDVLRTLRTHRRGLPVLVLTGRPGQDAAACLDAGADDYVTKPFRFEELLARIRARLRDAGIDEPPILESGPVRLDPRARRVTVYGRDVALTGREFALLEVLFRHPGRVLSREQLLAHAWGYEFEPSPNLVNVHVSTLRKKLGVDVIETLRGLGYRLRRS